MPRLRGGGQLRCQALFVRLREAAHCRRRLERDMPFGPMERSGCRAAYQEDLDEATRTG